MVNKVTRQLIRRLIGEGCYYLTFINLIVMSVKISNSNNVSLNKARIITTLVHIILILLAILPLLALKPASVEVKNKQVDNTEVNSKITTQPIAGYEVSILFRMNGGRRVKCLTLWQQFFQIYFYFPIRYWYNIFRQVVGLHLFVYY